MKKTIIIIAVLALLLVAAAVVVKLRSDEDKNSSVDVAPSAENKENAPESIGGQKDEHGCLIPAGYSWCEQKKKCLRTWEESCP